MFEKIANLFGVGTDAACNGTKEVFNCVRASCETTNYERIRQLIDPSTNYVCDGKKVGCC